MSRQNSHEYACAYLGDKPIDGLVTRNQFKDMTVPSQTALEWQTTTTLFNP
jgi:hypothetical protein